MKANANINILKIFKNKWLKIDCSSEYEAFRALNAWFKWQDLQVSWQETPGSLKELLDLWVSMVATSLKQLEEIWKLRPWAEIWIRVNPWMWSWAFKAISTGWETSAFWIWHEYIPEIKKIAEKYDLKITKIHIHIWSENTPESWTNSANIWLWFVEQFEDATCLDMWGWFKKAIMPYERSADLQSIWKSVAEKFEDFYEKTWRKIHLEVEPGKYMVINSCSVVAKVDDILDTWKDGYKFIRTNTWMTEMPRVPMYWVQQPITIVNDSSEKEDYIVVWHCCESWDILTSKLYDQETIEAVSLNKAQIWDVIVIDWTWAYNASMSMKNYNSFPEAGELMLREDWNIDVIRKRQQMQDIWKNEIEVI
jgi:diaminopimelate decarboxylase